MDKFTINGAKKLRGLARTKIRLAKEADMVYTNSEYLSEGSELKNINVILGHKILILTAICFALGEFKANVSVTE